MQPLRCPQCGREILTGYPFKARWLKHGAGILPRDLRRPLDTRKKVGTTYEYRVKCASGQVNGRGVKITL
jgi:hypothetical protein